MGFERTGKGQKVGRNLITGMLHVLLLLYRTENMSVTGVRRMVNSLFAVLPFLRNP